MSSDPRVVVVTGAASGIGHATAAMFAAAGDVVYGLDIASSVPDGVSYVECNVGSRQSVEQAIRVVGEQGRIDVLANVAGIVQFGRIDTITDEEWDRVHAVDLKGPFMLIRAALPLLRACQGNIVNVSSVAGRLAQPYTAAYAAAKGGLTQLTRALAIELAPEGIRVNAVCPGTVETPLIHEVAAMMTDDLDKRVADRMIMLMPHFSMKPEEVAAAIRYLASPEARSVSGEILAIDGVMG
jgi:meso-butanediol dehydrogenase / (S,S)-butanediol dehydrogenase / diacetyl reductase